MSVYLTSTAIFGVVEAVPRYRDGIKRNFSSQNKIKISTRKCERGKQFYDIEKKDTIENTVDLESK